MASSRRNRHIPQTYELRPAQASLPLEVEGLENKVGIQAEEINRLTEDNRKLAASHVALRQELVSSHQEIHRIKQHIRNIQAESDVKIRVLLDKITKTEADIKAAEAVNKELQDAHREARNLVAANHDLTCQIMQLEIARADVQKLPLMLAELDNLREEHQRLRKTFDHEKGLNSEKVERMQIMEKDLVAMAGEMERLRAQVLNAETRADAPFLYNGAPI